jgi:hypothetical protein
MPDLRLRVNILSAGSGFSPRRSMWYEVDNHNSECFPLPPTPHSAPVFACKSFICKHPTDPKVCKRSTATDLAFSWTKEMQLQINFKVKAILMWNNPCQQRCLPHETKFSNHMQSSERIIPDFLNKCKYVLI